MKMIQNDDQCMRKFS